MPPPTDGEKESEKRNEDYFAGYKEAAKFYDRNPKYVPPGPLDDLLKIKADSELEAIKAVHKLKEAQRYKPTPIVSSWTEMMAYQKKLYPKNFKTHEILVDDVEMGNALRVLWQANTSSRFMGKFSKIIRQMIAIIKRAREDYGVRLEVLDGGRLVILVDGKGNKTAPRPPEDWEKYEFRELFRGATRQL